MSARGDVLIWLEKVIGEREDVARAAEAISPSPWMAGRGESATVTHMAASDPESVLRRCAADRKLLDLHEPVACEGFGCDCDQKCKTCDWTASQELGTDPAWGETDHHIFPCPTIRALAEGYGWAEETSPADAQGQTPPTEGDRMT